MNIQAKMVFTSKRGGAAISDDKEFGIEFTNLKTALPGDLVEIKPLPLNSGERQMAAVTKIIKRAKTEFVGSVFTDKGKRFFAPSNRKIYTNFIISEESGENISDGDKVIVELQKWDDGSREPVGKIKKIIGKTGEHEAEIESIIFENNITEKFPANISRDAEEAASKINDNRIWEKREDFRETTTFTIDPDDAKDFDDAISFKKLPSGNIEVGIHIADVSSFVEPNTPLDDEAARRATSTYLVHKTIPMLPEILSNNVCSLVPNEDRLTFSAIFEIDNNHKIVKERFAETIINSNKRLTYAEAEEVLTGKSKIYENELTTLNEIAKSFRAERFANGAISLDTQETGFELGERSQPISIYKKVQEDAHRLIEEFMLAANKKVAEYAFRKSLFFVFRNHGQPERDKIFVLGKLLNNLGFKDAVKRERLNSKEINEILEKKIKGDDAKTRLVKTAILRTMAKANYEIKNKGHYGLAFQSYTHFTSPIRRYPDIMVHRLLKKHLTKSPVPEDWIKKYKELAMHASMKEIEAMNAERESTKFKQTEYAKTKLGEIYMGTIVGASQYGIYVEADDVLIEGMVAVRTMSDDFYQYDEGGFRLVGQRRKKIYRIGDRLKIQIKSADLANHTVDFLIV